MPIHDWTRVNAGIYNDFHRGWTVEIRRALNSGILPDGEFAMSAPPVRRAGPDLAATGGLAAAERPPRIRKAAQTEAEAARYAMKANRIAIHKGLGRVVAMIEVVSPGNKDSRHAVASFAAKGADFLRQGIHFLMIDPFPPGPRDPAWLARAIWDELSDEPFSPRPDGKPLTVAAFDAGSPLTAYVECLAVGDPWPEPPLFLEPGWYVNVPLEPTYQTSWELTPRPIRDLVATPAAPGGTG